MKAESFGAERREKGEANGKYGVFKVSEVKIADLFKNACGAKDYGIDIVPTNC